MPGILVLTYTFYFMRKKVGILAILILVLVPFGRWLFIEPINYRFFNFIATMTSIGQVLGIIGFSLFSINLILSVRLKIVERFFYGLNNIYNFHHKIGALSFVFLLFHPLCLVFSYLSVSLKSAADFFIPFNNIPVTYGSLALIIMTILIVLTFYIKLKYHTWKFSHKFMVLAFIFVLLHLVYIPSDISRDGFLRVYLLVLGLIGLGFGFYQAFLRKLFNFNLVYNLKKINILNSQVVELELEPRTRRLKFSPGQFIFIRFLSGSISTESHPFSISSGSSTDNLQIVVKSLGDFTDKLKNLQTGLPVSIEGPYGKFSHLNILNKNQVWVAGGVGITPFLSMARSLTDDSYHIDLYYCTNKPEEAVLMAELKEIEANGKIRIIPWYSSEKGYLSAKIISELSPDIQNKDILLCGPAPLMFDLKEQLLKLDIKRKNIHFENFQLL